MHQEKIVLSVFAVCFMLQLVSSHLDDGVYNSEEQKNTCAYLNSVRANYTVCCKYPAFVVWMWQLMPCNMDCLGSSDVSCCVGRCCYVDKMKLFTLTVGEDGTIENVEMNTDGVVASFMMSVGNDTRWEPVIRTAVDRCYNDIWNTEDGMSCGFIPITFFSIIDCVYIEHFLKCPVWNPANLLECEYTYKYVENCWSK